MSEQKTTLKDIAAALNVSPTTVHRALTGKSGISDQMREAACRLAAEMGYSTNLAAAALKRKPIQVGVLLPDSIMENRFYYASLWAGIHNFMAEVANLNVSLKEYYYPLIPGYHGMKLKEIYENHLSELNGLITLGVDHNQSAYFMGKIKKAGIPAVILGSDLYSDARICCVKACDTMAGSLAAELLTAFLPRGLHTSILLTGNPIGESGMVDQYWNLAGFQDYIQNLTEPIIMHSAYCSDTNQLCELTAPYLNQEDTLPYAIYSSSARHTVQMCHILSERGLGGRIRLIGNDNFPESTQAIRDGILTATIDKKIVYQAYTAARVLIEYLTRNSYPESELMQIRPEILMKSNLHP